MSNPIPSIEDIILNAALFSPALNGCDFHMNADAILESIPRIFELLEERQVPYLLVGGIAMLAYVAGRNTQDIDLLLSEKDLIKLPELTIEDRNESFARCKLESLQVALLLTEHSLFHHVASVYQGHANFGGRSVRCVTVEGLALLKLFALPDLYRAGKFDRAELYETDINVLLRAYQVDLNEIRLQLKSHLTPTEYNEVISILDDILQKITQSKVRFT